MYHVTLKWMTSFELKEHILENFHDIYEYNYLEFRSHLLAIFFFAFYLYIWLEDNCFTMLYWFNFTFFLIRFFFAYFFYQKYFDIFLSLARSIVVSAII